MLLGIFVESNEDLGLLYLSYKDIPERTEKFMKFIDSTIDYAQNTGIPKDDIKTELAKFKADVRANMIKSTGFTLKDARELIDSIKKTKEEVNKLLERLGEMRKKFRFGDNLIKGIIIKPKIYSNSIDDNDLSAANKYMNQASNALDWIEKVIVDLMNMCDQDLNLSSVMTRIYFRECHETSDFMEEYEPEMDTSEFMDTEVEYE